MYKNNFSLFKKAIITFLTLALMLVNMTVPANALDTSGDTAYLDAVTVLEKLGILIPEDQMQYSEETVSRETFASIAGTFYGFTREDAGATVLVSEFSDVDITAPNYGNIEFAVSTGLMDKDAEGNFRPSQDVTVGEVIKAMLVVLGYDKVNPQNDEGFYKKQGQSLRLLSGVRTAFESAVTKGELITILLNTLEASPLKMDSIGLEGSFSVDESKTVLGERFGAYKLTGVLQATDVTGIGALGAAKSGHVILGGYDIETDIDLTEFLGMFITAYCTGNDDLTELKLLYAFGTKGRNNQLTIQVRDVTDVKGDMLYYELDGRSKQVRIPSTVTVIYNGRNYPLYSFSNFMSDEKTREGSITLLDSDNDGKYETVFIKSYYTYFVDHVYTNNENVSFIGSNGNALFDFTYDEDNENKHFSFIKNGNAITLSDIGSKCIISVAADKYKNDYEFLISSTVVSGTVLKIDAEEVKVEDSYYKIASGFTLPGEISVGETAVFYIDAFGNVAYAENKEGAKNAYGMLESVKESRKDGCIGRITIFTPEGAHKEYECAEKIKIDGKKYKYVEVAAILSVLKSGKAQFFAKTGLNASGADDVLQVVKYSVNSDGKVTAIDTLLPNEAVSENDLVFSKTMNTQLDYLRWYDKAYAKTFCHTYTGESLVYDDDLVIFALPNDKSQTEAFSARKGSMNLLGYERFPQGEEPNALHFFDVDSDTYFFPLLIIEKTLSATVPGLEVNNMMIFEKQITEYNDEMGEVYHVLCGTSVKTGAELKAKMPDDVYNTYFVGSSITPGDVVRWTTDDLGIVKLLELTIDNGGPNSHISRDSEPGVARYDTGYYATTRLTCGNVEYFDNKFIVFKNGTKLSASVINPTAKVLIYDSRTKTTSQGDYSMIKTLKQSPADPSLVVTYQENSTLKSVVIFK